MGSLLKYIHQNPNAIRLVYLLVVLVFFTSSSLTSISLYVQFGLLVVVYYAWLRPFFSLVAHDLEKRFQIKASKFNTLLLIQGSWLLFLLPIDLIGSYFFPNGFYGFKLLIFLLMGLWILISVSTTLAKQHQHIYLGLAFAVIKNTGIMILAPISLLLFFFIY